MHNDIFRLKADETTLHCVSIFELILMMETNPVEGDINNTNVGEEVPGAEADETMQLEENQVHTTTVLDEHCLQQLMDSGTVSEDRYGT